MLSSLVQQSSLSVEQSSILSLSPMSSEVIRVLLLFLLEPWSSLTPAINGKLMCYSRKTYMQYAEYVNNKEAVPNAMRNVVVL